MADRKVNLKLNTDAGISGAEAYTLNPKKKYVIDIENELDSQSVLMQTTFAMGCEPLQDYWDWLEANGFNSDVPNPTNEFVSQYYGKKPLWRTKRSQGIAVRDAANDDYYIVLECSNDDSAAGYRHTAIILTLAGCL